MTKLTFMGAGSTVFAKNVLGDCILTPEIGALEVALYDIDPVRLEDSRLMLENINKKYNGKLKITAYTNRLEALSGADFVVNAIQVGGYEPCTVTDFEVPKKYGLRQTIADTLGIGGIFRALRTIPVLEDFAGDMHKVCPNALFLNYTNPMAMLTGYMLRYLDLNAIGLCHSVQGCAKGLLETLGMEEYLPTCKTNIAGINHQAWLLSIEDKNGNDLYPEIKRRSLSGEYTEKMQWDLVRHDIMHRFGYYNTESSEHTAEYNPYYIKYKYPELIKRFNIPLDEYPRRCVEQIKGWQELREKVVSTEIEHNKSNEFAAPIINAVVNNVPYEIHASVLNKGLITNLPQDACVEVKCLVDRSGVNPCYVGALPEQLAALNRTNINVQNLTIQAAKERKKDLVYMAAYLDPHTSAELSLDDIKSLCDDLFEAHNGWLPEYK
ncbi:MAG: alpha-glucosidase/alpha-galactosidase [Clostridiales bacterium]|nr:alpha-glucosidase/alpha-galactosidase [Clostridiales bacterium]